MPADRDGAWSARIGPTGGGGASAVWRGIPTARNATDRSCVELGRKDVAHDRGRVALDPLDHPAASARLGREGSSGRMTVDLRAVQVGRPRIRAEEDHEHRSTESAQQRQVAQVQERVPRPEHERVVPHEGMHEQPRHPQPMEDGPDGARSGAGPATLAEPPDDSRAERPRPSVRRAGPGRGQDGRPARRSRAGPATSSVHQPAVSPMPTRTLRGDRLTRQS